MTINKVRQRAWVLHRMNGHPPNYDGVCWGPTLDEIEQAKREIENDRSNQTDRQDVSEVRNDDGYSDG